MLPSITGGYTLGRWGNPITNIKIHQSFGAISPNNTVGPIEYSFTFFPIKKRTNIKMWFTEKDQVYLQ
jgi:hypothetical protein